MSTNLFQSVKQAIFNLDPHDVRNQAERPSASGCMRRSEQRTGKWRVSCASADLELKRAELGHMLFRAGS